MLSRIENFRENFGAVVEALEHMLVMVREKMLLPYHVERWNLMVDTDDSAVFRNLKGFMEKIYERIKNNFPQSLHKVYFMNVGLMGNITEDWNRKDLSF